MAGEITYESMTQRQKVAALLIALGPGTASEILKNIKEDEMLEQITFDIASLNKVPSEILNQVWKSFIPCFWRVIIFLQVVLTMQEHFWKKLMVLNKRKVCWVDW